MDANLNIKGFTVKENDIDTVTYVKDGKEVTKSINGGGGGSDVNVQDEKSVTVTENGTQEITPDAGYDSMKKVHVQTDVGEQRTLYCYSDEDIDAEPINSIYFEEQIQKDGTYSGIYFVAEESQGDTGVFYERTDFTVALGTNGIKIISNNNNYKVGAILYYYPDFNIKIPYQDN